MKKQMSVMGIGHKAGIILGGYLAVVIVLDYVFSPRFRISGSYGTLLAAGVILTAVGFSLNLGAAFQMLRAHKRDTLAVAGFYRIFLNPMYFLMLCITLPGVALLLNSYLVLTAVPVGLVAVKLLAREEERYLEDRYGEAYREYRKKVLIRF